ncbi:MAG TPA: GNAT family N-acetyltransferase [Phytomonospora sp.]
MNPLTRHFPLYGLRLTTPRLTLRLPDPTELAALGDVAADGVHDASIMPFNVPWSEAPPAERAHGVVRHHFEMLGRMSAERWAIPFAVFLGDEVVGMQDIGAREFAITRQVGSGSWLGQRFHGKGIGTEMRAAILHLAFEGLGAEVAVSAAHVDNPASLAVSRKLGYRENGTERVTPGGKPNVLQRLLIDREAWAARRAVDVEIDGLDDCRAMLGLA